MSESINANLRWAGVKCEINSNDETLRWELLKSPVVLTKIVIKTHYFEFYTHHYITNNMLANWINENNYKWVIISRFQR